MGAAEDGLIPQTPRDPIRAADCGPGRQPGALTPGSLPGPQHAPGPLGTPALVRTPFVVFHGKVQRRSGRRGSSRGDAGAWGQRSKSRCRPADPFVSLNLSKRQLSSLAAQATLPETVLTAAASLQCRRGQRD